MEPLSLASCSIYNTHSLLQDKEDMEDMEDKEEGCKDEEPEPTNSEIKLPQRCPICNKKKPNILLHIKTKQSCFEKIDKLVLEEWRIMARKKAKKVPNKIQSKRRSQ